MLQLSKEIDYKKSLTYILTSSKGVEHITSDYREMAQSLLDSDLDYDYCKIGKQYIFFVKESTDLEKMRVAGYNIRQALDKKTTEMTFIGDGEATLATIEGFLLSNYQFLKYFKDKENLKYTLNKVLVFGEISQDEVTQLNNTVKAVSWARDMVNEPVCYLTAEQLSEEIKKLGLEAKFKVTVMQKQEIEKLGMGGLLAVNMGSVLPPTFTVIEYKPTNPINKKPIALVGKGLVYDTGGLSLKPTLGSMDSMKSDMGGAACMVGAIYGAALNKLDVHLMGFIPATDNRPGQNAYTPGDVIKMFDGTTVEVLNTDAEGRVILADAISYANQFDPELIIDAATLTGAAIIVAGIKAACVMGNADQTKIDALVKAGANVHERLVQLPFWDDYKELLKSSIADMKNVGGRSAGTITAGKFLEHFAKHPYIHLDIAGPAFYESAVDYKGIGGTGTGVRTLINFFSNYKG